MSDLRWLNGYSGQTTDELIALEGSFRTDSIVLAFEQAISGKADRLGDHSLSTPERVVLAVEALEREVNNDGFDGLFRNASEHVPHLIVALIAIGAHDVADLTRSAIAELEIDGPLTADAITSAIDKDDEARDDRLNGYDETYYQTAGDLAFPLLSYIKANRDQINLIRPTGARALFNRASRSLRSRLDRSK